MQREGNEEFSSLCMKARICSPDPRALGMLGPTTFVVQRIHLALCARLLSAPLPRPQRILTIYLFYSIISRLAQNEERGGAWTRHPSCLCLAECLPTPSDQQTCQSSQRAIVEGRACEGYLSQE